jgi:hypothetical protein
MSCGTCSYIRTYVRSVRSNTFYDTLILKYANITPVTYLTSLSHILQHNQHDRVHVASQLHNKTVSIHTRSHTSYL